MGPQNYTNLKGVVALERTDTDQFNVSYPQYDPNTGVKQLDAVQSYSISTLQSQINGLQLQIDALQALLTDAKALAVPVKADTTTVSNTQPTP